MIAAVTITRDQLVCVLLNLGLATTGTGRTDEVFAALRAKAPPTPPPTPGTGARHRRHLRPV